MTLDPLIPLARAIAAEAARLEIPATVVLGGDRASVRVEGDALKNWGQRTLLESTLTRHGIRYDTHMPAAYIVAFPSASSPAGK